MRQRLFVIASVEVALLVMAGMACSTTTLSPAPGSEAGADVVRAPPSEDDAGVDAGPGCAPERAAGPFRAPPPRPWDSTKCSSAQLQGYAESCFLTFASPPVCAAFREQNPDCAGCVDSIVDDSTWGALVWNSAHTFFRVNYGGCIAHLTGDTSDTGCGAALDRYYDCSAQACASCPTDTTAEIKDAVACTGDPQISTFCASPIARYNVACSPAEPDLIPAACNQAVAEPAAAVYTRYMRMWCGPPLDGGADGSSPSDAGSD